MFILFEGNLKPCILEPDCSVVTCYYSEFSRTQTLLNNRSNPAGEKHSILNPLSIHHSDRDREKDIDVLKLPSFGYEVTLVHLDTHYMIMSGSVFQRHRPNSRHPQLFQKSHLR